MTSDESLEIISALIDRIEQLEARQALFDEYSQAILKLDNILPANQSPRAHAMIAGLIAYNKRRKAE